MVCCCARLHAPSYVYDIRTSPADRSAAPLQQAATLNVKRTRRHTYCLAGMPTGPQISRVRLTVKHLLSVAGHPSGPPVCHRGLKVGPPVEHTSKSHLPGWRPNCMLAWPLRHDSTLQTSSAPLDGIVTWLRRPHCAHHAHQDQPAHFVCCLGRQPGRCSGLGSTEACCRPQRSRRGWLHPAAMSATHVNGVRDGSDEWAEGPACQRGTQGQTIWLPSKMTPLFHEAVPKHKACSKIVVSAVASAMRAFQRVCLHHTHATTKLFPSPINMRMHILQDKISMNMEPQICKIYTRATGIEELMMTYCGRVCPQPSLIHETRHLITIAIMIKVRYHPALATHERPM